MRLIAAVETGNVTAEVIGNAQITHAPHVVSFAWVPMIQCHTVEFVMPILIILKLEDQAEDATVKIQTTMVGIDLSAFLVILETQAPVVSIVNMLLQVHVTVVIGAAVFV